MSKLLGFFGAFLIIGWMFLLVAGIVTDITGAVPIEDSLFNVHIPWGKWAQYATMFLVMGACFKYVFEDRK